MSSVKIDFDDEIRALILLVSLPNSWKAMKMAVSNSIGKAKLNFDDTRDLILAEEVRRIDSSEVFGSGSALNVENQGRGNRKDDRSSNRAKSKSRHRGKSRPYSGQVVCWNCQKPGHFKKDCRNPKREENNSANTVAVETVVDALVLAVHTQADDWVLDFGASFHTTSHQEIMTNYVASDFDKVYLANGESLNIVGLRDEESSNQTVLFGYYRKSGIFQS